MTIQRSLLQALRHHPILQALYRLVKTSGSTLYLVGGAVRDLLRGLEPAKDFDVVTADNPERLARLFSRSIGGTMVPMSEIPPHYRVVLVRDGRRTEVDFAAFRGKTLAEDLSLRDFTVNAVAFSVADLFEKELPVFHDPGGGIADVEAGILRITNERSFDDDPLRILRAVRIARLCGLSLDQDTILDIQAKKHQLPMAAVERIRTEFFKTLELPDAAATIHLLDSLGILHVLLAPLSGTPTQETMPSRHPDPVERYPVIRHCEELLDHTNRVCPDFAHDLIRHFSEELEADVHRSGILKSAGFLQDRAWAASSPPRSSLMSDSRCDMAVLLKEAEHLWRSFKLGRKAVRSLQVILEHQTRIAFLASSDTLSERMCFRYFFDTGPEGIEALLFFTAKQSAQDKSFANQNTYLDIFEFIHRLIYYYYAEYCIVCPHPLISGQDLKELFGLTEGKELGELLSRVGRMEAEGRLSTRDEALAWVRSAYNSKE